MLRGGYTVDKYYRHRVLPYTAAGMGTRRKYARIRRDSEEAGWYVLSDS